MLRNFILRLAIKNTFCKSKTNPVINNSASIKTERKDNDKRIDWRELMKGCNNREKRLLERLISKQDSRGNLFDELSTILDFERAKQISNYSIGLLTIALRHSNHRNVRSLRERCLNIYLFQVSDSYETVEKMFGNLGQKSIENILIEISNQMLEISAKTQDQKRKTKLKIQYAILLKKINFDNFSISSLCHIIYVVVMISDNQRSLAWRYRYGPIAKVLLEKFRDSVEKNKNLQTNIGVFPKNCVSSKTYLSVVKLMSFYEFEIGDNFKYFIDIISHKNFFATEVDLSSRFEGYMSFYRFLYWYQDEKTQRNPILDLIEQCYQITQTFNCNQTYLSLTFMYILMSKFHNFYLKLPIESINGFIVIKNKPSVPELSKFEQQFFKIYEQKFMRYESVMRSVMLKFYSDLVTVKNLKPPAKLENRGRQLIQNEVNVRVQSVLVELNIPFEREALIMNKKVDFLLPTYNLIIECDGDTHTNYKLMEATAETTWRNMIMLMSGYRMVVLDMWEINKDRTLEGIKSLLFHKIKTLEQSGACFVE